MATIDFTSTYMMEVRGIEAKVRLKTGGLIRDNEVSDRSDVMMVRRSCFG